MQQNDVSIQTFPTLATAINSNTFLKSVVLTERKKEF